MKLRYDKVGDDNNTIVFYYEIKASHTVCSMQGRAQHHCHCLTFFGESFQVKSCENRDLDDIQR